jgi:hypothetical protein
MVEAGTDGDRDGYGDHGKIEYIHSIPSQILEFQMQCISHKYNWNTKYYHCVEIPSQILGNLVGKGDRYSIRSDKQ